MLEKLKSRLRSDLWIVLLDIIAVNGAYLLAILIRFYVHFKFTSGVGDFREYYLIFTPYYTVACIFIFYLCGLYGGMWRYAGLTDMYRIVLASVITSAIHVFGTKLFVHSMPTSYYIIGGCLQFLMITAIRFAFSFFRVRKRRSDKHRSWTIPAMVVGSGDTAKEFAHYLEENSPFEVVVIAGEQGGKTMDGIPIVDIDSIPMQIKSCGVHTVFLADEGLSQDKRNEIKTIAKGVYVKDYLDYLSDLPGHLPLNAMLDIVEGPLKVTIDGVEKEYSTVQECLTVNGDRYEVKSVRNANIELSKID